MRWRKHRHGTQYHMVRMAHGAWHMAHGIWQTRGAQATLSISVYITLYLRGRILRGRACAWAVARDARTVRTPAAAIAADCADGSVQHAVVDQLPHERFFIHGTQLGAESIENVERGLGVAMQLETVASVRIERMPSVVDLRRRRHARPVGVTPTPSDENS